MGEIHMVFVVGALAICVAIGIGNNSRSARSNYEIEARMERMKQNPSPDYEWFPNSGIRATKENETEKQ